MRGAARPATGACRSKDDQRLRLSRKARGCRIYGRGGMARRPDVDYPRKIVSRPIAGQPVPLAETDPVPALVVDDQRRAELRDQLPHGVEVYDLGLNEPLGDLFVRDGLWHLKSLLVWLLQRV